MVDVILKEAKTPNHLDRVYETDMAEGLKVMALEGHGIAFLPQSAVKKELRAKKLALAGAGLEMAMDIRAYREKPLHKDAALSGGKTQERTAKRTALTLWDYLIDSAQVSAQVGKKRSA